jgi:hypothetical protein
MTKGMTHQENLTIVNIATPNAGTPNVIKKTLLDIKVQMDPTQHWVNLIPHSLIDRSSTKNQQGNLRVN